jgi:hypothetical protein
LENYYFIDLRHVPEVWHRVFFAENKHLIYERCLLHQAMSDIHTYIPAKWDVEFFITQEL